MAEVLFGNTEVDIDPHDLGLNAADDVVDHGAVH